MKTNTAESEQKASVEPESAQHSPLPWTIEQSSPGTMQIVFSDGELKSIIARSHCEHICDEHGGNIEANAKLIVASVNNAEKLAEALRAWEYAGSEGGISMVDWFEVAREKTRAALAQWENNQ